MGYVQTKLQNSQPRKCVLLNYLKSRRTVFTDTQNKYFGIKTQCILMGNQLRQSACINSKIRYNFVQVQCILIACIVEFLCEKQGNFSKGIIVDPIVKTVIQKHKI